jgi:hypothetical protein
MRASRMKTSGAKSRLRCFVAMAFERKDTDRVYDRFIAPVLRGMHVTPVRVDRIEHLEDINNKIVVELERCDFAVADLTYARPSVYFEAGFAQRLVPVVYTCRGDHLSGRADDKFGNFRIHFDLRMKNIVPWFGIEDRTFRGRLTKRVNHAISRVMHTKRRQIIQDTEMQRFDALSLDEKTKRILDICIVRLKREGYSGMRVARTDLFAHFSRGVIRMYRHERIIPRINSLWPGWLATKRTRKVIHAVMIHVAASLTKSELVQLESNLFDFPAYDINPIGGSRFRGRLIEHYVICTLAKVPYSRVQNSLPQFAVDLARDELYSTTRQVVPSKRIKHFKEIYLHDDSPEPDLLAINPGLESDNYHSKDHRIHSWHRENGSKERLVGYLTETSRQLHLRVFDEIKSENAFRNELSDWLKKVRGKCL